MTLGEHPMALMRAGLGPEVLRSTDLARSRGRQRRSRSAGMVVARQRPETAKGIVFMLLEDERGTVNLIVPPPVYERHRAAVRAAPLIRASGRLERREGTDQRPRLRAPRAGARRDTSAEEAGRAPDVRGRDRRPRAPASAPSPSCAPSPPPATASAAAAAEPVSRTG